MKVAFQMDPIDAVDIHADTTFDFAITFFERGHECYYYPPSALHLDKGQVKARAQHILNLQREVGNHVRLATEAEIDLDQMDVIFLRQDPPFDMAYITSTHILEHIQDRTLIVNNPASVRNAPEKLFVTHFPDVMPPTLISSSKTKIEDFLEDHRDIIIKPLYGAGGAGIFRIKDSDPNLSSLLELFTERSREPLIAQQFVPDVAHGDKRVLLLDGEPVGAINRVPDAGQVRANMHVGGRAEPAALTERDLEICEIIGPSLRERGLIVVGIDIIGRYITEINVTSPTGVQELKRFSGVDYSAKLAALIEQRAAQ